MFEARFKPLKDRVDECDVIMAVGTATDMSGRLASQTVIRIDDDPDRNRAGRRLIRTAFLVMPR